jgi:hypothetical protein
MVEMVPMAAEAVTGQATRDWVEMERLQMAKLAKEVPEEAVEAQEEALEAALVEVEVEVQMEALVAVSKLWHPLRV